MNVALAVELLLALLAKSTEISALIQTVTNEGRDFTVEEWAVLERAAASARQELVIAIAAAKAREDAEAAAKAPKDPPLVT